MDVLNIVEKINELFNVTNKEVYSSESGVTYHANKEVKKLGYCVNLTLETIEQARVHGVDMMVTHHDAWDEIYGLKDACIKKLKQYGISHYYNHLPLDDCNFGTNDSLLRRLKLEDIFGIESLALKLNENIKEVEVMRLNEEHYEANIK